MDCRPNSDTFGKWIGITLDSKTKDMLYLPEGIAHGFLVLSDTAQFTYKCTDFYDPENEGGIPYDDPTINILWPKLDVPYITSPKDKKHLKFCDQKFECFSKY